MCGNCSHIYSDGKEWAMSKFFALVQEADNFAESVLEKITEEIEQENLIEAAA